MELWLDNPDERLRAGMVGQVRLAAPEPAADLPPEGFVFAEEGLQLPPEVANYIVNRAPRGLGDLLQLLERLDRASLVEKRPLSIPLVKRTMGW